MVIDVRDRVPQNPNQYKLTKSDGSSEIVTLERNDNPVVEGSLIGRYLLMAIQGFIGVTTEFLENGDIKETNEKGDTLTTSFLENGSIQETFLPSDSLSEMILKTTFNADGSITKEVL